MKSRRSFKFGQIRSCTSELPALKRLKKTYNGRNDVATLGTSVLMRSSSFLQVTRTCVKAWMSLNSGQILPLTTE